MCAYHPVILQVILLLDVDFVATRGLHDRLSGALAAEGLAGDATLHRHAIVLPAFETSPQLSLPEGHSVALQAVASEHLSSFPFPYSFPFIVNSILCAFANP